MSERKDSLILRIQRQVEKVADATIGTEQVSYRELEDRVLDLRILVQKLVDQG